MKGKVAFWVLTLSLVSCQRPSALSAAGKSVAVNSEKPAVSPIYFEKTACFGRCPVFIFQGDGNLHFSLKITRPFYKGNLMKFEPGLYHTEVDQNESQIFYERIDGLAQALNFKTLENVYDNAMVTDLPSTILEINGHRVRNRYGGPNLNELYAEIENQMATFTWLLQE